MWLLKPEPVHHDVSQAGRNDAGTLPVITHRFSLVVLIRGHPLWEALQVHLKNPELRAFRES